MITVEYVRTLARYNAWQNSSILGAASTLTDPQRREPRGAFFGSIHATLNHILWADRMWLHRFAGTARPEPSSIRASTAYYEVWDEVCRQRGLTDVSIEQWAAALDAGWLGQDLTWHSAAAGRDITRPRWLLVTHFFNHQTHHRGQVHCLLTGLGAKPDDTDLMLMQG